MSETSLSTFGGRTRRLPRVVRRLLVAAAIGAVAASCVALAYYVRPERTQEQVVSELEARCEAILEDGEDTPGQLASCEGEVAHRRAMVGKH